MVELPSRTRSEMELPARWWRTSVGYLQWVVRNELEIIIVELLRVLYFTWNP